MSNPDTVRSTQMPANDFSLWFYPLEVHTVTTHVNLYLYSYVSAPLVFKKMCLDRDSNPFVSEPCWPKRKLKNELKTSFFSFLRLSSFANVAKFKGGGFFCNDDPDGKWQCLQFSPQVSLWFKEKREKEELEKEKEKERKEDKDENRNSIRWFYNLATYTQVHFALKCKFVFTTHVFGKRISLKMYLLIGVTKLAIKNDSGRKIVNMIGFKE